MSDLRNTLEEILSLCNTARTYSRRTQHIHEVAMYGLGMTAPQRHARHVAVMTRIGDVPLLDIFLNRAVRRQQKQDARATAELAAA